jgi:hypothetical protein
MDPVTIAGIVAILLKLGIDEIAILKQRGEWTPEQDAAFWASVNQSTQAEYWRTDAERKALATPVPATP